MSRIFPHVSSAIVASAPSRLVAFPPLPIASLIASTPTMPKDTPFAIRPPNAAISSQLRSAACPARFASVLRSPAARGFCTSTHYPRSLVLILETSCLRPCSWKASATCWRSRRSVAGMAATCALKASRSCRSEARRRALGFFVCEDDLEDERIRAVGAAAIQRIAAEQGDIGAFRTLQKQPEWRGRPVEQQLRRWLGSGGRRKTRYATLLVEAVDLARVPRPLD